MSRRMTPRTAFPRPFVLCLLERPAISVALVHGVLADHAPDGVDRKDKQRHLTKRHCHEQERLQPGVSTALPASGKNGLGARAWWIDSGALVTDLRQERAERAKAVRLAKLEAKNGEQGDPKEHRSPAQSDPPRKSSNIMQKAHGALYKLNRRKA
eukprot:6184622-Pleurochrysis_carterae.AAC.2